MKLTLLLFALILLNILGFAQEPVKLFADKTKSSITYSMKHPLHSWEATSKDVNSVILTDASRKSISQAAVSVKISTFDSQNANRDSHCLEVTDAIKYPSISFASTSIKFEGDILEIKGKMTFHGVTKEITVSAVKETTNNKIRVSGNFSINMKDYNIDPPSLMALETDPEIKLSFNLFF